MEDRDSNGDLVATHNTWQMKEITSHPAVDAEDPVVRTAAEHLHRNESLHRHDPRGVVCIYCAMNASRVARVVRQHAHTPA